VGHDFVLLAGMVVIDLRRTRKEAIARKQANAKQVEARQGKARQGKERQGKARQVEARHGKEATHPEQPGPLSHCERRVDSGPWEDVWV
jgi:hypothetical protein